MTSGFKTHRKLESKFLLLRGKPPPHPRATHHCPDFMWLRGHNWRGWTLLAHSFVLQPFNCPSFVLVCFVCIFWPCISLKWPCIIFWTVSIWGRNPSWQVQQKLQFNGCISNSLKAGFEVLRHQFQRFWNHNTAEDVQACVIYVCLQLYCCLDINRGSDSIPVSPVLRWYKPPKEASEVGNLLVEKFSPTETARKPAVCEWDPEVGAAGQGSCGTGWPSTAPTASVLSHKPKQERSLEGEEDAVGALSLSGVNPMRRRGRGNTGGDIACRVLPTPAPLHGAHRRIKACLLLQLTAKI